MRAGRARPTAIAAALIALTLALAISACGEEGENPDGDATGDEQAQRSGGTGGERRGSPELGERDGDAAGGQDRAEAGDGRSDRQATRPGDASAFREAIVDFGEPAEGSEREAVAAAARSYLNAFSNEDGRAACRLLTAEARQGAVQLGRNFAQQPDAGCARAVAALAGSTADWLRSGLRDVEVQEVRLKGDRAVVIYDHPRAQSGYLPLVRENGAWRSAGLAGQPLPELEPSGE